MQASRDAAVQLKDRAMDKLGGVRAEIDAKRCHFVGAPDPSDGMVLFELLDLRVTPAESCVQHRRIDRRWRYGTNSYKSRSQAIALSVGL
jgi:hypothetical protein